MISRNFLRICVFSAVLGTAGTGLAANGNDGRYPPLPGDPALNVPPPPPAVRQNQAAPVRPANTARYPAAPARPAPYPGGAPYGRPPYGGVPYGRPGSYGGVPYGRPGPYGGRPYNGGWNRGPWGGNRGPYGGRDPFNSFFGGSRYGDGPFGDFFGRRGFGGRDGFLGMHPEDWFTGGEDGLEQMWDEMINAPSEMGEMPGGWSAPEVSMPNPVDVQRQFRDEAPEFVREVPDMININP